MRLLRLTPRVPTTPVVTGTVQMRPLSLVVGVPTVAPDVAVPVRVKLVAATPVAASLKVIVKSTVEAVLGLGSARTKDDTTGALSIVPVAESLPRTAGVFISTDTVLGPLATARSGRPSPLRSATATEMGSLPTAKVCWAAKAGGGGPAAVVFSSTDTVLEP